MHHSCNSGGAPVKTAVSESTTITLESLSLKRSAISSPASLVNWKIRSRVYSTLFDNPGRFTKRSSPLASRGSRSASAAVAYHTNLGLSTSGTLSALPTKPTKYALARGA